MLPFRTKILLAWGLAAFAGSALGLAASASAGASASGTAHRPAQEDCMRFSPTDTQPVSWGRADARSAVTPPEWCEAVGPVVSRAGSSAGAAVDELVIVTWNVRVGGGQIVRLVEDLRSGALTGRPARDFVLLLQEAYRAGPEVPRTPAERLTARIDVGPAYGERADVAEVASRLGLWLFYAPSMPNGAPRLPAAPAEDRGNAILSTLPLDSLAAIELPFEVQRRVAVAARVSGTTSSGSEWTLRVASGHLDTRSHWTRFLDSFGAGRARQAAALAEWLEGDRVALGADLNTWSLGFLEDALGLLQPRFPATPRLDGHTFSAAGVIRRRLDHLLLRLPPGEGAELRRVDHRYGSDHHPLVGVLRFPSPAAQESGAVAASARPGA